MITGGMLVVAAFCLHNAHRRRFLTALMVIVGLGLLGVGVFPDNRHAFHHVASLTTFLFGGLLC